MKLFALLLIVIGFYWLARALKPTRAIRSKTHDAGWKLLLFLIIGFLFAYASSIVYILLADEFITAHFAHAALLCGGGGFVYLVTRFTLSSIQAQEYQASHDRITDLQNRHSFVQSVQALVNDDIPFYIMLIDLNGFKQFNSAFGHPFGDALLTKVGEHFSANLSDECRLFRIGGDEFAILGKKKGIIQIEKDVAAVQQWLKKSIEVRGQNVRISASIGVSAYPEHSENVHELVQQAEQAMYACKNSNSHWNLYSEALNDNVIEHLAIAQKLQHAIENNEFQLFYQPIITADDSSVHGAEVLIRWRQSDGSYISPEKFIPIAEQSTLIHDITCWVIARALEDLQVLDKHGFSGTLHINLSAKDLHSGTLLKCLEESAASHQVEAQRLVFEVTESAMLTDVENAIEVMTRLSALGYSFSLDDFGTGFSSFSLLRDLPLSQIKIDRSFVMSMSANQSNQSIVSSMVFLARALDFSVVAEGVEDEPAVQSLTEMRCDYLQGYYFSKPLPLSQFVQRL